MGTISFEGEPPFVLPVMQRAEASGQRGTVEMTLFLSPDGGIPVPVQVQMVEKVATALGHLLVDAAAQARAS